MRADRLLSILMILQARGKVTALALGEELEVSERTIYRDVEALSGAGVPLYAERGPGGGIALLEDYRTNLTGLNGDEVRALFMLSIPSPLMQLGVGQELRAAMLKLSAALPESRRREQQGARQRIHLDAAWWGQSGLPGPHLLTVQQAVWQDRRLRIVTRTHFGAEIELSVDPLGLVAKASEWYLVARREDGWRVFKVSDLVKADLLEQSFLRPPDFDLPGFWAAYCRQVESERGLFWAELRISAALAWELPVRLGDRAPLVLAEAGPPDETGWRRVRMPFDSLELARDKILTFGGAAEVLEPPALARSVADFADQIRRVYEELLK